MAQWSITPSEKKSLIEIETYSKDGNTIVITTTWRWGEFTCETEDDEPPEISRGEDLWCCGYDVELVEVTDGDTDYDMTDCDAENVDWLEQFLDDNSYLDLEERGWIRGDSEMLIECEPEFEMIDE